MQKQLPSFERMLEMAENDPEALERLRQEMVREAINSAPEAFRQRLHGLQFQIDGQRLLCKSPIQACMEISKMMHNSLHHLKTYIDGDKEDASRVESEPAKILPFPSAAL